MTCCNDKQICVKGGCIADPSQASIVVSIATSGDPNALAGSLGYGQARWVSTQQPLSYSVFFENLPTAGLPAAAIVVTDHLDATKLDLTTVNLQKVSFGSHTITPTQENSPPVGTRQFKTDVDLRPAKNLKVHVNASLDMLTADLTWTFTSIDPDTGLPPDDPTVGFLDPGQEGSVLFTVMPKAALRTGTVVSNQATIVFDYNLPMNTNSWSNTIDGNASISRVKPLAAVESNPAFLVSWAGTDVGTGVREYTIYVSDNGGAFTPWLNYAVPRPDRSKLPDPQATFTGQEGHTYAFYSAAVDYANNIEPPRILPDTSTFVTRSDLKDVSAQVTVKLGILTSGRTKGHFEQTAKLTNTGGNITGPVWLVLDGLNGNVSVVGTSGTLGSGTPPGSPYVNVTQGNMLAGASVTVDLQFTARSISDISYSLRALAGSGKS